MVAADPVVPGTPNSTAGMVSDVVVTDPIPSRKAKAANLSMSNVNGSNSAMPTIPPRPGITPRIRPMITPPNRNASRMGSDMMISASPALDNISSM